MKIKKRYLSIIILFWFIMVCFLNPLINGVEGDNHVEDEILEPYDYWYSPFNSFGVSSYKEINDLYFENWFNDNTKCKLEGQHPINNTWLNATQYLNESYIFNDEYNFYKMTWNFTTPKTAKYRITYVFNSDVINYINKSSYEISLFYNVSNNETYSVYFNFSDLKIKIENGSLKQRHGFKTINNETWFWCRFTTSDVLNKGKFVSLDPTFGETDPFTAGNYGVDGEIMGSNFIAPTSGIAESVTVRIRVLITSHNCSAIIYDSDENLIGHTESKIINPQASPEWITFNFTDDNATIISGNEYNITFWQNTTGNAIRLYYNNTGFSIWNNHTAMDGVPPPDPWNPVLVRANRHILIYCTYREVNDSGIITSIYPLNNSINICPFNFFINVTVEHCDCTPMDILFESNKTGSWSSIDTIFNNVGNGSYALAIFNATHFGYDYYIRITLYNFDDNSVFNRTIYKYTITENVNCSSVSNVYSKDESDDLFLSAPINVESDFLVVIFILYFFYMGNKHEDFAMTLFSSLMLFVMGIYYAGDLNTIDVIITVVFVGLSVYGMVLSYFFLIKLRKLKQEKQEQEGVSS